MIKTCKICNKKYHSIENEYITNQDMDNICLKCAEGIIRTSDNTKYE
jgi:hypothetical protein